ncbi:MAG: hypothetical protein U9O89_00755 [Thermoproteota archaeon]|nr:hypothetical protein [Thermoproteota archaeon]
MELAKVNKKWGAPTETYRLTARGEKFLRLLGESIRLYKQRYPVYAL